ncbi:hypothetical protein PIB30_040420 [Stylosanthes scabra]|uniref:Non-lysosomal glucosylceramidase n=1 Tax=Stylosanthes scabra TaxID=79078 RepID=A0ABU6SES7_9FABA|nr:hypothetical protein [Stylosanthes scabra]
MVSGNIFHCRKNSWPPEEYISKATLQLFDFDSAAPPEQAWRRRLNSHANLLKEFSVTFMEAIKMVRLGIRIWSYVREEASHGRKAPIDPFTRESCKPSATQGVPLGGMGSGSISRGFRGEFRQWQIIPGLCEPSPVMANQFSIFVSRDGGNKSFASVLAPGQHEGLGSHKKADDQGISSWGWNLNGQHSTYHALFPRAWTVYDGEPDPELKVSCRQISPFIPHNYRESSLPAAVFVYTLVNTGKERAKVSLLFTWANSIGGNSHLTGGHVNEPFIAEDGVSGVLLHHKTGKGNPPVTFAIAACETQNVSVSVLPTFGLSEKSSTTAKGMWCKMVQDGHFDRENFSSGASMPSLPGETLCAAVSASTWVEPHGKCTVAFSLAWSSPKVKFSKGSTFHRRYTKFYGTSERAAKNLAHDALTQYKRWEEDIEKWQNPILQDESLPEWYKFTLFNELYFLVAGGTIWIDSPLPSSNMRNKSQDQVKELENTKFKVTEAKVSCRQGAAAGRTADSTYDVEYTTDSASDGDYTVDGVDEKHHGDLSQESDASVTLSMMDQQYDKDDVGRFLYLEGVEYIMWCTYDVYRDFAATGDMSFGVDVWPAVRAAMEYMEQFDRDGDGLIENDGFPDQTYDTWTVHGISAYCGCLWLAALQAAAAMALQLGDRDFAETCKRKFLKAKPAFEEKLWNGSYFNYDSGSSSNSKSIQADQLAGQWYTASSGLPPLFDESKIKSALRKVYDFNVMKVKGGKMGAVNGMHPNGKVDETCMQSREIWTGVTYGVASTMILAGMQEEAFTTAEGIFLAGWSEDGYGYWFQTPEAWTMDGHYRSLIYMRPLSIWGMQYALTLPKAILEAPKINIMDRIHLSPNGGFTHNETGVRKIANKAKCFGNSVFHCSC